MAIDNDTRGWIMTCISGVACVLGAAIICVDIPIRHIHRWRNFSISESDGFLSASLSLSFGVMLFSALYSMLPQSQKYLKDAGYSPHAASYLLIGLFLAGVAGIQVLSRVLHHFIPSHVVDCDHTHEEEEEVKDQDEMSEHAHDDEHTNGLRVSKCRAEPIHEDDEDTPLLSRTTSLSPRKPQHETHEENEQSREPSFHTARTRRISMMPRTLTRTLSKYVNGQKSSCDETGPCMGFTDPCGQDCFKAAQRRGSIVPPNRPFLRSPTWRSGAQVPAVEEAEEQGLPSNRATDERRPSHNRDASKVKPLLSRSRSSTHHYHHPEHQHPNSSEPERRHSHHSHSASGPKEHHHHVPTNAFMSIGLQTSLAIALHKAPEGFITYATNHANPTLGFSVFMALFIHNITEGFAMALPLYLAIGSRTKAIAWSAFLGGASQPLGAGIAALWFKLANRSSLGSPTEGVYGGMFAVTSGVMASVALSLFAESLQLSHNKGTCIAFAFLGMAILGFSFALTAT
ncbi:Zinc transporter [Cladophialophora chaetospira]|uniref:Zinc transporter n=1 Tax=Cladophialophora chaetospira TaxID=386627 RepID=A0AA39CMQ9_9EURO|nr:Zinc transporter [Cladophialophora chaetospira]